MSQKSDKGKEQRDRANLIPFQDLGVGEIGQDLLRSPTRPEVQVGYQGDSGLAGPEPGGEKDQRCFVEIVGTEKTIFFSCDGRTETSTEESGHPQPAELVMVPNTSPRTNTPYVVTTYRNGVIPDSELVVLLTWEPLYSNYLKEVKKSCTCEGHY